MLKVENISTGYGKVLAIKNINIHVDEGEIVVLIGANGAGKTTLLRTISGILKPRNGKIDFLGYQNIESMDAHHIVRLGIVHVQEGRGILSRMTVMENLLMGAYLRSGRKDILDDMERIFEKFPILKERIYQNAGTLSGGEQQMLAIGRALMSKPRLFLLDEPSLGLAPLVVENIFQTIRNLKEEGNTILLVEQNANQALHLADRGYVMETGEIVIEGSSRDLLHNKEVQRAYLG